MHKISYTNNSCTRHDFSVYDIIFDGAQSGLHGLLDTIKADAKSWATTGASGLAALLPTM
jgi:hypothetical protein